MSEWAHAALPASRAGVAGRTATLNGASSAPRRPTMTQKTRDRFRSKLRLSAAVADRTRNSLALWHRTSTQQCSGSFSVDGRRQTRQRGAYRKSMTAVAVVRLSLSLAFLSRYRTESRRYG